MQLLKYKWNHDYCSYLEWRLSNAKIMFDCLFSCLSICLHFVRSFEGIWSTVIDLQVNGHLLLSLIFLKWIMKQFRLQWTLKTDLSTISTDRTWVSETQFVTHFFWFKFVWISLPIKYQFKSSNCLIVVSNCILDEYVNNLWRNKNLGSELKLYQLHSLL